MTVKISRSDFLEQFSVVWLFRHDLPDVMLEDIQDIRQELKEMNEDDDYSAIAEWVNDILREEGLPELFPSEE